MKKVILVIAALVALLLIVGVILPAEYRVERSITIDAPVETVFEQVNNLEHNRNWSPWEEDDPSARFRYSPVVVGVGAWYDWEGEKVGVGRLEITAVEPNRRIETDLAFGDTTTAVGTWEFTPGPDGVEVTWAVVGELGGFFDRYFGFIAERVISENFERGLANLKRVAEAAPPPPPPPAAAGPTAPSS